jgi:hypothetical protein
MAKSQVGSRYRTAGISCPENFGKTKIETRNSGKN